jgi:hypothetical protein
VICSSPISHSRPTQKARGRSVNIAFFSPYPELPHYFLGLSADPFMTDLTLVQNTGRSPILFSTSPISHSNPVHKGHLILLPFILSTPALDYRVFHLSARLFISATALTCCQYRLFSGLKRQNTSNGNHQRRDAPGPVSARFCAFR